MKAILPVFDESRHRPYYLQLYDYLKEAILSGDIAEGEKLPSLRGLSRSTGLSLTTIENAYNQLLVEGYIQSRASSGYYANRVHGTGEPGFVTDYRIGVSDRAAGTSAGDPGPAGAVSSPDRTAVTAAPILYDPDCFDFNKWKKCMNRVLNESSPTLFFEGSPQGEAPLRKEIANYLYRSRGVSCHPDHIFIGAGTQQITGLLATALKSLKIRHIAVEDPGYIPVRNTFRDRGFDITEIEVDENGLRLEDLPVSTRSAAYVSPSNNSFTGSLMPIGRRYEMIRWAIANDSYIIEDDYDSELRYFGRPIPPIRSLADDERVIYLGSFSSTLFAAVRISYMVLPPHIAEKLTDHLIDYSQTCSKLEQLTLASFMETGLYQTHIRKLRKLYSQKLSAVTDILRKEASDIIEIKENASGINLLLKVRTDDAPDCNAGPSARKESGPSARKPSVQKMIRDAESLGIPVVPSRDLILLTYNQIPLSQIPEITERLIALWRH